MRSAILLASFVFLAGCATPAPPVPVLEGRIEYDYAAYGSKGNAFASGVLVLPALIAGDYDFKGSWQVAARGPSEDRSGFDVSFQNGRGKSIGWVRGREILIHFHPDTIGTDHDFWLTGRVTDDGAYGTWGFATEGGAFPRRGAFTLLHRPQ